MRDGSSVASPVQPRDGAEEPGERLALSSDEKTDGKPAQESTSDFDRAEDELVELFLREDDKEPAKRAFVITAAIFIVMFLSTFPVSSGPQYEVVEILVPELPDYIPPLEQKPKQQKIEKQKVKKVALPDPTPEEPEPLIEPPPEPEPEPLPPNVKIRRGIPRGPPRRGGPVREGMAGLTNPQKKFGPDPIYPTIAKRANFGGQVILRAIIAKDGTIKQVELLKGLGRFGLDEAAIVAVKKWRYSPGILEGNPVEVIMTVRVNYTLH